MFRKIVLALCLAPCSLASAAPLQVSEFNGLPSEEQDRILDAAYHSASVALAFAQGGEGGSKVAAGFSRCLRDRDVSWLRSTLREYLAEFGGTPTSLGGAVTQSLAWKCGFLTLG